MNRQFGQPHVLLGHSLVATGSVIEWIDFVKLFMVIDWFLKKADVCCDQMNMSAESRGEYAQAKTSNTAQYKTLAFLNSVFLYYCISFHFCLRYFEYSSKFFVFVSSVDFLMF